jgi:hypothetical protein
MHVRGAISTTADSTSADSMPFGDFVALFSKPASTAESGEGNCIGYACFDTSGHLTPWKFARRATGPHDVRIQITYAGICHSDIHQVRRQRIVLN